MATLNELGRNSASITYGPYGTGQDLFPTLQAVDAWLRNDTWQGYATASGNTVTGVGTIFTTQARAGDVIIIAGQQQTVLAIVSDTSLTIAGTFSPAVTLPSAIKVINTTAAGTVLANTALLAVRNNTNGRVSVTSGSNSITGVGTYFLTEATNSVVTVTVQGTIAIDASGNITGTGTIFQSGQGVAPAGQNGLFPGDYIAVTSLGATSYYQIGTVTSDTAATLTITSLTAIPAGATIAKATNGVIGRRININGRIRTISAIQSNTAMTVNFPMDFTDSNLKYKVYARGTLSNATSAGGTLYGATSVTATTGTNLTINSGLTGLLFPGMVISGTNISAGTTIVNQQFGVAAGSAANTPLSGAANTTTVTVVSTASLLVGHLLSGNGGPIAGISSGTYITSISGLTLTLNNPLTSTLTSVATYFYVPGGLGLYTISLPSTASASAATFSSVQGTGTNFLWDLQTGDQVWVGDEIRTVNFNTLYGAVNTTIATAANTNAWLTDYTGYSGVVTGQLRQTVFGLPFHRDESYITGNGSSYTTDLRVGDDLIIDGTECTITQVVGATQFRINMDFTHTANGATVYKKKKLHGFVLEGTREGGPSTTGKWSQTTSMTATNGLVYDFGATTITVAAAPTANATAAYQFVKISGAGGTPIPLTGQINTVPSSATVTGVNTLFTSQLHIGAEIVIAGQYLTVIGITSDVSMTVNNSLSVTGPTPFYRSIPLYTYVSTPVGTAPFTVTLGTPIKNTLYANAANPPQVYFLGSGGDFIEYVYSAPNKTAEATTTLFNTSNDRKYFGFRFWPLYQSTQNNPVATATIATAQGAYATPVYERWVASYAQSHGVGINMADCSGGNMIQGSQATTTLTLTQPIAGSTTVFMNPQGTTQPALITASLTGVQGIAGSTYTVNQSNTIAANSIVVMGLNGVFDVAGTTQTTGGFFYMFANPRYFVIQGKSFANIQTQWQGVIEFERAQPEDTGTGLGTTTGISFNTLAGGTQLAQGAAFTATNATSVGFSQSLQYTPGIAPWPCYAYFNSNRFPVGSAQYATLPVSSGYPIHGGVFATPRVRNSSGDLVGINAHIYSAATITTGRWGHVVEFGASGAYLGVGTPASNGLPAQTGSTSTNAPINTIPQIHMGQIIPVYTNVYNSKRFMFSPVVVLGPSYDPDIRGRIYGLKVIPSNLGTLMDTVSITIDSNYFYDSTQTAADHWVVGSPPTAGVINGQQVVSTYRFTTQQNSVAGPQQSWRSLEDISTQASNTSTTFTNNFRWALPA